MAWSVWPRIGMTVLSVGAAAILAVALVISQKPRGPFPDIDRALLENDTNEINRTLNSFLFVEGTNEERLSGYQQALALAKHLVEVNPDTTRWIRRLSDAYCFLGNELYNRGDRSSGLKNFRASVSLFEARLDTAPNNKDFQADLADAQSGVSRWLFDLGEIDLAMDYFNNAVARRVSLVEASPNDRFPRGSLLNMHDFLGAALEKRGDTSRALATYKAATSLIDRLGLGAPDDFVHMAIPLADIYRSIGRLSRIQGNQLAAARAFESEIEYRRHIYELNGPSQESLADIALSMQGMGDVKQDLGEFDEALEYYRDSLDLVHIWIDVDPGSHGYFNQYLPEMRLRIGQVLRRMGNFREAIPHLGSGLMILEKHTPTEYSYLDHDRLQRLRLEFHQELALTLEAMGKAAEAAEHRNAARAIREKSKTAPPGKTAR